MEIKYYSLCIIHSFAIIQVLCADTNRNESSMLHTGTDVTSCKSGQVLNGSDCINITECRLPVLSNRRCMQRCPVGYIYFTMNDDDFDDHDYQGYHYTLADIDENPCYNENTFYVLIGLIAILNGVYIVFVKMFLSTNKYSLAKLKTFVCCKTQTGERERLLNINTDDDTPNYNSLP
ncbi:uncharacterized protein LOC132736556 isoform X2 [Ruditapes philippinarum]|uniref:uncharacterized protein LOC132736556 isoform X2 n=1 Tax=Ruditapes philippinarum TaxID=129788 RepID=UPI00295ABE0B|nr:uncharacterized protein LOC132736556 isoform X2 [Ruditapes philippinarum]